MPLLSRNTNSGLRNRETIGKNLTKVVTKPLPAPNHSLPTLLLSSQDKDWHWMEAETLFPMDQSYHFQFYRRFSFQKWNLENAENSPPKLFSNAINTRIFHCAFAVFTPKRNGKKRRVFFHILDLKRHLLLTSNFLTNHIHISHHFPSASPTLVFLQITQPSLTTYKCRDCSLNLSFCF